MTPHDPCRSETLELLDYAQSYEREGLLLYDGFCMSRLRSSTRGSPTELRRATETIPSISG